MEAPDLPKDTPRASLDKVMQVALDLHPGKVPMFASHEIDDDRFWYVTLGDTPTSEVGNKTVAVDARSAAVLAQPKFDEGFMYVMFKLHVDLFAGLPGKLFLGLMGLLRCWRLFQAWCCTRPLCASWTSAPCGQTGRVPGGWTCTTCWES